MLNNCYCVCTTKHLTPDICRTTLMECFWVVERLLVVVFPSDIQNRVICDLSLLVRKAALAVRQAALLLWCPCFTEK